MPADVILTGTPAGVGHLQKGDILKSTLNVKEKVILDINSKVNCYLLSSTLLGNTYKNSEISVMHLKAIA